MRGVAVEVARDGREIAVATDEDLQLLGAEGGMLLPLGMEHVIGAALDRLDLGDVPVDGLS